MTSACVRKETVSAVDGQQHDKSVRQQRRSFASSSSGRLGGKSSRSGGAMSRVQPVSLLGRCRGIVLVCFGSGRLWGRG